MVRRRAEDGAAGARRLVPALIAVGLAITVTAAIRLALPTVQRDGVNAPASALAQVPPALARQHMLNEYGFGGFLIFNGLRPFIDGRAFTNAPERFELSKIGILAGSILSALVGWLVLRLAKTPAVEDPDKVDDIAEAERIFSQTRGGAQGS